MARIGVSIMIYYFGVARRRDSRASLEVVFNYVRNTNDAISMANLNYILKDVYWKGFPG